ncbi:phosphomethylpyrimidine synthase ThiC [Clostridium diolis]|uniref:phosphomethylpyrimidine synthase ThiC n=1 Tax=Clostridium diolis TaxID=223919 RepID=UPI003AF86455
MKNLEFRGNRNNIFIGDNHPIAVNLNVGITSDSTSDFENEKKKIDKISKLNTVPNLMMDLSLSNTNGYIYEYIKESIGCPIGIIPHYFCTNDNYIIDRSKLIYEMERAASLGVAWFVIHLTPTKDRVMKAMRTRKIPFSSRSATIIIKDMIARNENQSIYWDVMDDIIRICKRYNVNISLGSAFRAAVIGEALDDVHCDELFAYKDIIKIFQDENIGVFTEGIGHCSIKKIDKFIEITKDTDVPIMPLGPLMRDIFNRDDNIVNAIGFYLSVVKGANFKIINSITAEEHSGGIPNIDSVLEGYRSARCCADMCNEYLKIPGLRKGESICTNIEKNFKGCSRCDEACPTKFSIENKQRIFEWINQ